MTVRDDLIAARELIADPKRWTTGTYARTAEGKRVDPHSTEAVCFCAAGALERRAERFWSAEKLLEDSCCQIAGINRQPRARGIAYVNDSLGHAAILKAFDIAIANAEASQ